MRGERQEVEQRLSEIKPCDSMSHSITPKEMRVELHMQTNAARADVHVHPGFPAIRKQWGG